MVKKGVVKDNSSGVVGVVLGIMSIATLSMLGTIFGVVGLIFSMNQRKVGRNKWSKAGIILNIIGIVLGIAATVFLAYYATDYLAQLGGY